MSAAVQEVNYRVAVSADLPALCALGSEVSLFHHEALPEVFARPAEPGRDAELWRVAVESERSVAFIAECGTQVMGFVTGQIEDEEVSLFCPVRYCRVGTLGVTVAARGRGIGTGLMASLERWAISHAAAEVHLNVWTFNEAAMRLYAEIGYQAKAQFMVKRLAALMPA